MEDTSNFRLLEKHKSKKIWLFIMIINYNSKRINYFTFEYLRK